MWWRDGTDQDEKSNTYGWFIYKYFEIDEKSTGEWCYIITIKSPDEATFLSFYNENKKL